MAAANQNEIDASPTKRLVVFVITKDIRLEDAILDLIDNSIDGARRSKGDSKLFGYTIDISCDHKKFAIKDNCGGMSIGLARDNAFRFGRPEDYTAIDGSSKQQIGNFGIGMKRALLKMGNKIKVISRTTTEFFEINIDVEKWLKDDKKWTFEFTDFGKRKSPLEEVGTTIEVTSLYPGVADRFGLADFHTSLKLLIRDKEVNALAAGIAISLNDRTVDAFDISLLQSSSIKPIYKKTTEVLSGGSVHVKLYAGVAIPNNDQAGWNVVCNGRTIIRFDRSEVTGWGNKEGGDRIASYHHQFARFRGFLFFDSDTPNLLPWNTTKTGVDVEHPLYRKYRLEMIAVMKEIFSFLSELDREKDSTAKPLEGVLGKAKSVALTAIKPSVKFVRPAASQIREKAETLSWIRYQKPGPQVKKVMESLGAGSPAEAGEQTFDLYLNTSVKGKK